jgi:hypothetical protein
MRLGSVLDSTAPVRDLIQCDGILLGVGRGHRFPLSVTVTVDTTDAW